MNNNLHLLRRSLIVVIEYLKNDKNKTINEKQAICILQELVEDLKKWEKDGRE